MLGKNMKLTELMRDYFNENQESVDARASKVLLNESFDTPIKVNKSFDWDLLEDPKRLKKEFKFDNDRHLLDFIHEIREFENENHHHGKLTIEDNDVTIEVWTHSINDVTEIDFEYARAADQIKHDVDFFSDEDVYEI